MAVAADVLAAIDPELELPRSVRETGAMPWRLQVAPGDLGASLADATQRAAEGLGDGRLAVIVPAARQRELAEAVSVTVPDAAVGRAAGAGAARGGAHRRAGQGARVRHGADR